MRAARHSMAWHPLQYVEYARSHTCTRHTKRTEYVLYMHVRVYTLRYAEILSGSSSPLSKNSCAIAVKCAKWTGDNETKNLYLLKIMASWCPTSEIIKNIYALSLIAQMKSQQNNNARNWKRWYQISDYALDIGDCSITLCFQRQLRLTIWRYICIWKNV